MQVGLPPQLQRTSLEIQSINQSMGANGENLEIKEENWEITGGSICFFFSFPPRFSLPLIFSIRWLKKKKRKKETTTFWTRESSKM